MKKIEILLHLKFIIRFFFISLLSTIIMGSKQNKDIIRPLYPQLQQNLVQTASDGSTYDDEVISNKDTFFDELNQALERPTHPAVTYILAKPHARFGIMGIGINFNWYGHSAVMYTMPNGERKVFNI